MNLIELAIKNVMRPVIKQTMGMQVTYYSSVTDKSYVVTASRSNSSGEAETTDNVVFTYDLYDFKIDSQDLKEPDGTLVVPNHLDRINAPIEGTTGWFQVLNDGQMKFAEQMDNWGCVWRIRCKQIPEPQADQEGRVYGTPTGDAYGTDDGSAYGPPRID